MTLRVNQSLAKTAASVNYPSARPLRLIQIDAPVSSRLSRDSPLMAQTGSRRSGRACLLCPGISDINLFCYCQSIKIAGPPIDQSGLGSS